MATDTRGAFDLNTLYNYSAPQAKPLLASVALPNWDYRDDMFYSGHGMVETTTMEETTMAPIQEVTNLRNQRGAYFRTFVSWWLIGEPDVGDDAAAGDNAQTSPLPHFDFYTTVIWSPTLRIPHEHRDRLMSLSITRNYRKLFSQWYASCITELITINATSMVGNAETYYAFVKGQTGSINDKVSGKLSTFSRAIQKLHAENPITTPQRTHTAWRSNFDTSAAISPGSANKTHVPNVQLFNQLVTFLNTRSARREGFLFEKPRIRIKGDETRGESLQSGWVMAMLPEHCYEIKKNLGDGEWVELNKSAAGAMGFKTGLHDGRLGEIFGMNVLEFNKLPRYWGGAAGDVPIGRCIIFGAQAVMFGFRDLALPEQYRTKLHPRLRRLSEMGLPVDTYVVPKNGYRTAELHTEANLGCSKVRFERPDTKEMVDKGIMVYDAPYTSFERAGIL